MPFICVGGAVGYLADGSHGMAIGVLATGITYGLLYLLGSISQ